MSTKRMHGPLFAGALVALLICLLAPSPALASHNQVSIFEDDVALALNPGATMQELRHLGVDVVRVGLHWSVVAPSPNSRRQPRFNATDPNAYPRHAWDAYDTIIRDAAAAGLKVLLVPTAFAPVWGQGTDPARYHAHNNKIHQAFKPNAGAYGQFVKAAAIRYSGRFKPKGAVAPLPRVSYWEIYNEPNFGEDIAPQAIDGSQVLYAPIVYRSLLNAAWNALHVTGHGRDTILIGSLAAHGLQGPPSRGAPQGYPGTYGETKPLSFIRALYCVDNSFNPYRGAAARLRSCPATAAASARFRSQNPALFGASGFSDHPYPANQPPTQSVANDPNNTDFSQFGQLAATLDRIQRVYHSGKRFPLWNTEYSYITDPPNRSNPSGRPRRCRCHYVSPNTAGAFINWTEYLSWANPRIASTMQYLLFDPNPTVGTPDYGGFSSGLLYYPTVLRGAAKTSYFAYRLPIYMTTTSTRRGRTLQVWGDVRPARYAIADGDGPQYAQIQFSQHGGPWITEKTLRVTDPHGYFQTSVAFPASGWVRIAWSYPTLDTSLASALVTRSMAAAAGVNVQSPTTSYSRSVGITVK